MLRGVAALALAGAIVQTPPPLQRFVVLSDGHPMSVWARVPASPRGAVLLVHGRTWSSLPDFDLQVPGLQRSVMISIAARGFAAYAVDLRGYGQTPRDATGWLTPSRAAADVGVVAAWIARQHPALPPASLLGWSRGAAIAMLAAQNAPARVSALVLFGFAFDPMGEFLDEPVSITPGLTKNTAEDALSDFVSPAVTPPAVVKAFVAQALAADPIMADLRGDSEFNALRSRRPLPPTLLLYGERDTIDGETALRFFAHLASADKARVVLPGADHAAQLEDTHDLWISAVVDFISR